MSFIKNLENSLIYHLTKKPTEYVRIDEPKTLQDCRQIQFNKWCKAKGVFCGSYLPKNPKKIEKKGWKNITSTKIKQVYIQPYVENLAVKL